MDCTHYSVEQTFLIPIETRTTLHVGGTSPSRSQFLNTSPIPAYFVRTDFQYHEGISGTESMFKKNGTSMAAGYFNQPLEKIPGNPLRTAPGYI